jgi:hypothetical protein
LPPSNTIWDIAIAGGFVLGLALVVLSSAMLRAANREGASARLSTRGAGWPRLVDEKLTHAGDALRRDMIERLSMVPGAWSRDILERARSEERDPQILAAIEDALRRV